MRRCDKHPCGRNQPYFQFSFEKSLRKYEQVPHKKTKGDHCSLSKPTTAPEYQHITRQPRPDASSQKGSSRELQRSADRHSCQVHTTRNELGANRQEKMELDQEAIQYMAAELQNQPQIQEASKVNQAKLFDDQFQKQQQLQRQQKQEDIAIMRTDEIQKFIQNAAITLSETIKQNIVMVSSQALQNVGQVKNQDLGIEVRKDKSSPQKIKVGRVQLTQHLSVSLRTINRYRQNGICNQEIVQRLLKRQKFGSEIRCQVAEKLKELLQLNQ